MGIPARFEDPRFLSAIDRVADVAARRGLAAGINADDIATCQKWIERGYRAIAYSADHRLVANGLRDGVEGLRRAIG
jgi:2-keto-3-deoxy-L-rhamnonate aldolase RhmA